MRIDIMDDGCLYIYKNVTNVSLIKDSNEMVITYIDDDGDACNKVIRHTPDFTAINEEHEVEECPKFRNQQEKDRVFHTVIAFKKFLNVIGNDDTLDDVSVLEELVRKMEVER